MLEEYKKKKDSLKLKERYLSIFEYRNGLTDEVRHTLRETGKKFGISGTRVSQIEARVWHEVSFNKN